MNDLNQTIQTIERLLLTEQASPIKSRADIGASELRRKEIQALLQEVYEPYQRFSKQCNDLPQLPNEKIMNWAEDMLSLPNLAVVVLDTTGVKGDSDVIGVYAVAYNGLPIIDLVIAPQRQHTANTAYTGISQEEIELAPTLEDAWPRIIRALKGYYFVSFGLGFVEDRLADNIEHYGLSRIPHVGDCLMKKAKGYFDIDDYGYNSGLKLVDACARIGHTLPTPALAADRAQAQLALLKAMSNGVTNVPAKQEINAETDLDELKDHPF